jgi:hypothetical protein
VREIAVVQGKEIRQVAVFCSDGKGGKSRLA